MIFISKSDFLSYVPTFITFQPFLSLFTRATLPKVESSFTL